MNRLKNYVMIHTHTHDSNPTTVIDSCTKYQEYIDRAKELGMKAIAFTEHGGVYHWVSKKLACDEAKIKYIHAIEAYVAYNSFDKLNRHVCLYAKNWEGVKEINRLVSKRVDGEHFYRYPRIFLDELKATSDNIIVTSACVGGVLTCDSMDLKGEFLNFMIENKHRCFLEIQHHLAPIQVEYNKKIIGLSRATGIPLIVGTDTHSLDKRKNLGRTILQVARGIKFDDMEGFDTTLKTYDELVDLFKEQGIDKEIYLEALENTNRLADMVEDFELDRTYKYPRGLYQNPEKMFDEEIKKGLERTGIINYPQEKLNEYLARIEEEKAVYKELDTVDYMLFQQEQVKAVWEGIHEKCGYGRGSVNGSLIAYLLGITEMDSIKWNLNFFRFLNPNRKSMADVDLDWSEKARAYLKEYLFKREGINAYEIITFNTIATKGAIRYVCKYLKEREENPVYYNEDKLCDLYDKSENKIRKEYPELMELVDIIEGTIVSVGSHASGVLVTTFDFEDYGITSIKDNPNPVSVLNMKEIDYISATKFDLLGLDSIDIINRTCEFAGVERPTPDNIDFNDVNVWNSIKNDTTSIFQFESENASGILKRLFSEKTIERIKAKNPNFSYIKLLSFANLVLRPSGASFRDLACEGIYRDNGLQELNDLLLHTLGYLASQEQIMLFLQKFAGYSQGESDTVRRGIAKKYGTEELLPEIKARTFKTLTEKFNVEEKKANEIIEKIIQVILDASDYGFSDNHSDPYSVIGYVDGWLRYYYPLEYLTSCLNVWTTKKEKTANVMNYIYKQGIKVVDPMFRYSRAEYFYDRKNKLIYKGIESISYLNKQVAEELYEMRDMQFNDFIDLLVYVFENTSADTRQIKILIGLDYFKEFGGNKYLLDVYEMFVDRYKKTYVQKTKDKRIAELKESIKEVPNATLSISQQMVFEYTYMKYVKTVATNIQDDDIYFVLDKFDKWKHPMLTLYRCNSGEVITKKLRDEAHKLNPFTKGVFIKVNATKDYQKFSKNGKVDGVFENCITEYTLLK